MRYFFAVIFIIGITIQASGFNDTEPNNTQQQANNAGTAQSIQGVIQDGKDFFRVTLPATGAVTVTLSGYPAGADMIIGVEDFPHSGWAGSEGRNSVSYTFNAEKRQGYIIVHAKFVSGGSSGNWAGQQFTKNGPFYSVRDGQRPSSFNGFPVVGQATYTVSISMGDQAPVGPSDVPKPATPPPDIQKGYPSISSDYRLSGVWEENQNGYHCRMYWRQDGDVVSAYEQCPDGISSRLVGIRNGYNVMWVRTNPQLATPQMFEGTLSKDLKTMTGTFTHDCRGGYKWRARFLHQ